MPSIKNIKKIKFNEEFIFFKIDSIVSEIADSMSLKNIGAVPILDDDNTLQGVVSERDIVRKCVKNGRDPDLVSALDIMTTEIITVDLNTSAEIAIKIMGENNIRHLPVVDKDNKLINFISHRDLISSVRSSTRLNIILIAFICMIIPLIFLINAFYKL
ncbi:CBS domain-containing protein [Alphaproteobacteria bacterium]|nr:CBS domain-containing protein [Alphaproteobacteria bacterium]